MKTVEFLYFYLMPEMPSSAFNGGTQGYYGSQALWGVGPRNKSSSGMDEDIRSPDEKQALLGKHLANVEDLVEDLRGSVFGGSIF